MCWEVASMLSSGSSLLKNETTTPSQGSLNILRGIHLKDELTDQAYVILLKLVKK
jgi:hypothetical protein